MINHKTQTSERQNKPPLMKRQDPATSRRDNKTQICSACSLKEALADKGVEVTA